MTPHPLLDHLKNLPAADRRLLLAFCGAALVTLALGVLAGAGTALVRAGVIEAVPLHGYRLMTLHGVTIFFYWLYFAQAGLLLAFSATHAAHARHVEWRRLAWLGFASMTAGLVLSLVGASSGSPLLYDAPPELARHASAAAGSVYLGYLFLAAGLFCVALSGVASVVAPRFSGHTASLSPIGFAAIAWAGLLMVSAVAAVNAFLPAALWAFEKGPLPADYATGWHVLFHNMHYLPLMATVVTWYVLVKALFGIESIYGPRFSKIVFSTYLIFVPPTSLYHMFLEPDLAEPVRVIGSLLSLFISVPTVLVFLLLVASLETHARAHGATGLFGWIRMLPWRNPVMAAVGMAVVNLAVGGALSFVLIQEKLAPLLSDTFFVPGYFHFLTVGTVTLTFLGALCYVIPGLTGRPLWSPRLLATLPYVTTAGLALFGTAGIIAGYLGTPRRMLDVSYAGDAPAAWQTLMGVVGAGGTLMALALILYVLAIAAAFLKRAPQTAPLDFGLPTLNLTGVVPGRERAWAGPLSILVLVGTMALFTVLAFEMMKALPLAATGGGGH
jgi:cytochrome c oxidase subunit I